MSKKTVVTMIFLSVFATTFSKELKAAEPTKGGKVSSIEYISGRDFKRSPLKEIGNGTFYYWNEANNPELEPKVDDGEGVKSIEILPTTSTPKGLETGESNLARIVKIPPNPPKAILVKFKTRLTAVPCDKSWLAPTDRKRYTEPHMLITFAKESGETGGGATIPLGEPNGQWVDHQMVLPIPTGADYLKIGLATYCGYNLALGNWTIQ
jgi:hypothetical protein